jgi:GNAT superfamily N-acetyltransferase
VSARPIAADFNTFFRGAVFGNYDIFSRGSYADFVRRNDIDLARAVSAFDGATLTGALAFGLRGERSWFGLIGVHPKHRRAGIARRMLAEAIDAAHAAGARRIELEISQRNAPTLALTRHFGFVPDGELLVWARAPHRGRAEALSQRRYSEGAVAAIAHTPYACWQREPRSVALARNIALVEVPDAYAFVRLDGEFANVLDAGARDDTAAQALLRELDARLPYDLTLNNEPADSVLSTALRDGGWHIVERQYSMVHTV